MCRQQSYHYCVYHWHVHQSPLPLPPHCCQILTWSPAPVEPRTSNLASGKTPRRNLHENKTCFWTEKLNMLRQFGTVCPTSDTQQRILRLWSLVWLTSLTSCLSNGIASYWLLLLLWATRIPKLHFLCRFILESWSTRKQVRRWHMQAENDRLTL